LVENEIKNEHKPKSFKEQEYLIYKLTKSLYDLK